MIILHNIQVHYNYNKINDSEAIIFHLRINIVSAVVTSWSLTIFILLVLYVIIQYIGLECVAGNSTSCYYFKVGAINNSCHRAISMASAGVSRIQQLIQQAKTTFSYSRSDGMYTRELEKLRTVVSCL